MRFIWLLAVSVMGQDLFTGAPLDRNLAAGEKHAYRFSAQAGQFLDIRSEQLQGDIAVTLLAPDGARIVEQNTLTLLGTEVVFWIAKSGGEYRIEVSPQQKAAARYRLEAAARTPTEADQHRATAYALHLMEVQTFVGSRQGGTFRESGEKMVKALAEWRAAGETALEAQALNTSGLVALMLSDNPKAQTLLEEAVAKSRGREELVAVLGSALNNLGQILLNTGQLARCRTVFDEALQLYARHPGALGEATTRSNYAGALRRLGEYDRAFEMLGAAVELNRKEGNVRNELLALQGLATTHLETRNFQAALEISSQILPRARAMKFVAGEFVSTRGMATAYHALGEYGQALPHYERGAAVAREFNDNVALLSMVAGQSAIQMRMGDTAGARKSMDEVLALSRKITNLQGVAFGLLAACTLYTELGDYAAARPIAAEALTVTKKASPGNGYARALLCAAKLDAETKDYAAAAAKLQEAAQAVPRRVIRVELLDELARLEQRQGRTLTALTYTEEAAVLAEVTRSQIADPTLRASNNALGAERVRRHTELLMALHRKDPEGGYGERAFQVAERARARTLAEMIDDSTAFRNEVLPVGEAEREEKLLGGIAGIQRELFREGIDRGRQAALRAELREAESEYDLFQAGLGRAKARALAEPMDAARLRADYLGADAALVEYALGEAESYAWVVTKEGLRSVTLPGRAAIEKRVEGLRAVLARPVNALTAGAGMAAVEREAGELRRMLVAPLEAHWRGKKRLIVVPDGALGYVPFEALGLLDRVAIRYAPSASALGALRRRARVAPERALFGMADPVMGAGVAAERGFTFAQLPNARSEVQALGALFGNAGSRILVGAEANEKSLKAEALSGYRYLHFATHGYFDEANPARSGLVLARGKDDDGFLQAREIFGLKLNADVVTLSACQSGLGKLLAGEGVMGLPRAFFYAGAQSVVVSLWNVNDAATAELMKTFYAGMKAGLGGAEALRRAKISLATGANRAWRHPYFWAPFVFMGESE